MKSRSYPNAVWDLLWSEREHNYEKNLISYENDPNTVRDSIKSASYPYLARGLIRLESGQNVLNKMSL